MNTRDPHWSLPPNVLIGGGDDRIMKKIALIVTSIVLIFCGLSVSHIRFFDLLELKLFDVQFGLRAPLQPDRHIVIAAIDEKSLKEQGQWPWPRDRMAALVRELRGAGAKVIAFDVVFAEADRAGQDEVFARELHGDPSPLVGDGGRRSGEGTVVLGSFIDNGELVSNVPLLSAAAPQAYFNIFPDSDGVVRRMPLLFERDGGQLNALSLAVVSKFTGFTPIVKKDAVGNFLHIVVGERSIPIDAHGRMLINYLGRGAGIFPHVSASDIISGNFDRARFKDAIVIVGATAAGLSDVRPTPVSSESAGIDIHASIIDNVLTGRYIERAAASEAINMASLVLIGAMTAAAFSYTGITLSLAIALLLSGALLGIGHLAFVRGLWVPLIYQVLELAALFVAIMLYRYFTEGREKRRIHDAFKFYLAPSVIKGLLKDPSKLKLGGERREITILFSDVRNFTTISEGLEPEKLVGLMNEYFTKMTDIIIEEGGLVDKYIGDAIMAFFGAPADQPDHAERACNAAVKMQAAVAELAPVWKGRYGISEFKAGIGINTGTAHVGNMGSLRRFNYTAIGDSVNVASRLEGLTKQYGAPIIVSGSVVRCVAQDFSPANTGRSKDLHYKSLGKAQVKGKAKEVEVFELLGDPKMIS